MGRKKIEKAAQGEIENEEKEEVVAQQNGEEGQGQKPKTKKIAKKGKELNNLQQNKKKQAQASQAIDDLFPPAFLSQIKEFRNFFSDYLALKSKRTNIDPSEELNKISNSLSQRIHAASNQVIKQDLLDAQKWVEEEQAVVSNHIKNVDVTLEETKGSLEKNLIFTPEEVDQQLAGIRRKRESLEKSYNSFEEIKKRIENLYKDQIDEE